jgi:hypothetical protein
LEVLNHKAQIENPTLGFFSWLVFGWNKIIYGGNGSRDYDEKI